MIVVHSSHLRCGIAEYGRQLDAAMAGLGAWIEPCTFDSAAGALPGVAPGNVVLIHFEPSLVPDGFIAALRGVKCGGGKIVLCCHHFALSHFSFEASILIDRFVVHRDYGVAHPKIVELPLACPSYDPAADRAAVRDRLGLPAGAVVVTTLGFLSQWKRTPDVVDALLARLPRDVFLQILQPRPFNGADAGEEARVRAAVAAHGADRRVLFSMEFRPEVDLLDRVYASDMGFLYHGQNTGSASAAAKQFVSARTPVVLTDANHTADIIGGVLRAGVGIGEFADACAALAAMPDRRAALRAEAEGEYARLGMNAVAGRYLDLFESIVGA